MDPRDPDKLTLGNVLALLQDNIRRMLAYSSVAHGGYMLMGIIIACSLPDSTGVAKINPLSEAVIGQAGISIGGIDALLVYPGRLRHDDPGRIRRDPLPERAGSAGGDIDDLAGVGQSHPVSAAAMAVFLFSLIGCR